MEDDTVIIIIEDNGVGIGEKQLEELRHTLDSKIVIMKNISESEM